MVDVPTGSLRIEQPPQTLRTLATERLREAIFSGYFKSGARLVERTLCDELGVSRSVIRESLRYLEAEGLVEFIPNKGPVVAALDWPLASQIYKVRLLLESDAARDCARVADGAVKASLTEALDVLSKAYSGDSSRQLYDASSGFYQKIFEAAGHDVAWDVVKRLNGRISRLRALTLSTEDRHASGFARMKQIHDAILANDPDAAAQAVLEHIEEVSEIVRQKLEEAG